MSKEKASCWMGRVEVVFEGYCAGCLGKYHIYQYVLINLVSSFFLRDLRFIRACWEIQCLSRHSQFSVVCLVGNLSRWIPPACLVLAIFVCVYSLLFDRNVPCWWWCGCHNAASVLMVTMSLLRHYCCWCKHGCVGCCSTFTTCQGEVSLRTCPSPPHLPPTLPTRPPLVSAWCKAMLLRLTIFPWAFWSAHDVSLRCYGWRSSHERLVSLRSYSWRSSHGRLG
jgi:hypothetical protein